MKRHAYQPGVIGCFGKVPIYDNSSTILLPLDFLITDPYMRDLSVRSVLSTKLLKKILGKKYICIKKEFLARRTQILQIVILLKRMIMLDTVIVCTMAYHIPVRLTKGGGLAQASKN